MLRPLFLADQFVCAAIRRCCPTATMLPPASSCSSQHPALQQPRTRSLHSPTSQSVTTERLDRITIVTLDRPHACNAGFLSPKHTARPCAFACTSPPNPRSGRRLRGASVQRARTRLQLQQNKTAVAYAFTSPYLPLPWHPHQAFIAFDDDDASDVAVFHGANGAFCAGWDLVKGQQQLEENRGMNHLDFDVQLQQQQVLRVPGPMGPSRLLLSKPVIAAIRYRS